MTALAIFDLDKTLLRVDSLQRLVRATALRHPALVPWAVLRRTRLIGRARFAEQLHRSVSASLASSGFIDRFTQRLSAHTDPAILEILAARRRAGEHLVLVSSSPHPYVEAMARRLDMHAGHGSDWRNGAYDHLYGAGKVRFLDQLYPRAAHPWRYAVSDSRSDLPLLQAAELGELWDGSRLSPVSAIREVGH